MEAQEKGIFEKLWNYRVQDHPIRGILGVCADGDYGKNEDFDYIMSVVSTDTPQEPMVQRHFPAATWAVFELESKRHCGDVETSLYGVDTIPNL